MPAPKIYRLPVKNKQYTRNIHGSEYVQLHFRYTDPITKERCRKVVYGKTEAEAKKKKDAFLRDVARGLRMAEQEKTTGQWAKEWVEVYKKPLVSEKRLQSIGYEIDRILEAIGYKPLSSVTQADLQAILNARKGLSADAISKTKGVITALFQSAVDNRFIAFSPATGLIKPSGPTGTHRALTDEEINIIVSTAPGHRFGVAAMLMLFAGLRRGEAADFHSRDVNLKAGTITVNRAVSYTINQGTIKKPKSSAGVRTIPIMPPLLPFLEGLEGYAISRVGDGPLSMTALKNAFNSFLIACELKLNNHPSRQRPTDRTNWRTFKIRSHDLRHTYATFLYDAGVDIKSAQRWLGHASPELTMRIYTHLSSTRESQAIETASTFFSERFK